MAEAERAPARRFLTRGSVTQTRVVTQHGHPVVVKLADDGHHSCVNCGRTVDYSLRYLAWTHDESPVVYPDE